MSSFLLPLKVEGAGTALAESFASYFARLAHTHALSRSQLTRLLASWRSTQSGRDFRISETPVYSTGGTGLFGYRERVDAYVSLVEDAVGSTTIRRSTLIPIRPSLASQCLGSVKTSRAWCEACFEEDLLRMEVPYDRFLWTLAPVTRCHVHRLRLRDGCPSCGNKQRFHHRSGNPFLCVKCGGGLVGPADQRIPNLAPSFGEGDCIELVGAIASGSIQETQPEALLIFENTLESVRSPLAGVVRGISEKSGSARARKTNVRPSLSTLLKKAFTAGVRAVDLLTDPEGAAMIAGQLFFDRHEIPVSARHNYAGWIRTEVETALKGQLTLPRSQQIAPLREIAKQTGVSESYIRRQFPSLVKAYQSHRMAASVLGTVRMKKACRTELIRVLADENGLERWSHKKELESYLVRTTGCSYPIARSTIAWVSKKNSEILEKLSTEPSQHQAPERLDQC